MSGMMLARQSALAGAVNWANITGSLDAENADQTMPYSTSLTVGLSGVSGSGQIYYEINNGGPVVYSAPFSVTAGQLVHFGAQTKGAYSATVTITRTGAIPVDTFTVTLT